MTDRSAETTATRSAEARPTQPRPSTPPAKSGTSKPAKPAKPAGSATRAPATKKPARRARLRLTRIDPWSVMKTAFLLAIAFGVVTVVSVFIIWSVLAAAGVWDSVNKAVQDVVGGQEASSWDVEKYVGLSRVMGFTMVVAVVDVVLITAIATLGAFLYNMAAALLGGVELTLAEDQH
jgi:hypothetical protein